jgi:hypothetical protein
MTPPTIVATPGDPAANSYVTVAEADAYFGAVLYADAWAAATATLKARALISATLRLEQEEYLGRRTTEEQALAWPRVGVRGESGYIVQDDIVPTRIKRAQMKLALVLLGEDILAPTGLEAFESAQVDVIRVTMRDGGVVPSLPADVARELAHYRVGGLASVRLRRS